MKGSHPLAPLVAPALIGVVTAATLILASGGRHDGDVMDRLAVTVVDRHTVPMRRQAGCDLKPVCFQTQPGLGLDHEALHPTGRHQSIRHLLIPAACFH